MYVSPLSVTLPEKATKAEIVAALRASDKLCDEAFAALTDASAAEAATIWSSQVPKLSGLTMMAAHAQEHYGKLVTYMRLKGVVPPTSEPKPQ